MSVAGLRPCDAVAAARAWLRRAQLLPDAGLHTWTSRIGDTAIAFRCTDPDLAALYRARLACPEPEPTGAPGLRLDLLETSSLGWPAPSANLHRPRAPNEEASRLVAAGLAALMPAPQDPEPVYPWVFFDPSARHGVMLVPDASVLPPWSHGAPFALLLHLAFAWRGWRFLHAAALGYGGRGTLLAGPGGAGKSGTTLAGLANGLVTAGDDYLLVEPSSPPRAWPVYRVLKQDRAGLRRVGRPDLAAGPENWMGKVELDLEEAFPNQVASSFALGSILLPEVAGVRRTTVAPATPPEAFSAIARSLLTQMPGARTSGFSFITRLSRVLPAHHLALSADAADVAGAVREVIAG